MKEIHVAFPPAFSRIMCFEADGVKCINDNFKYEESAPASPNHEQSKDAQSTTVNGCCGHCTTAAAGNQEEES